MQLQREQCRASPSPFSVQMHVSECVALYGMECSCDAPHATCAVWRATCMHVQAQDRHWHSHADLYTDTDRQERPSLSLSPIVVVVVVGWNEQFRPLLSFLSPSLFRSHFDDTRHAHVHTSALSRFPDDAHSHTHTREGRAEASKGPDTLKDTQTQTHVMSVYRMSAARVHQWLSFLSFLSLAILSLCVRLFVLPLSSSCLSHRRRRRSSHHLSASVSVSLTE